LGPPKPYSNIRDGNVANGTENGQKCRNCKGEEWGDLLQIFLSYAAENKDIAEPIAFSLRARGHKVFFDRDDLPPGGEYDKRIQKAVERSALFVFLLSPAAIGKGRFTLTELEFARRYTRRIRVVVLYLWVHLHCFRVLLVLLGPANWH
jgi:TIR domain